MTEPVDPRTESLATAVIGCAIEVHRVLGPGFPEAVYEESMAIELAKQGLPFERQRSFEVRYCGRVVGAGRLDLLVGGSLVVELKAVEAISPIHKAQVLSYLRATGLRLGLILNFNCAVLKSGIARVIV